MLVNDFSQHQQYDLHKLNHALNLIGIEFLHNSLDRFLCSFYLRDNKSVYF